MTLPAAPISGGEDGDTDGPAHNGAASGSEVQSIIIMPGNMVASRQSWPRRSGELYLLFQKKVGEDWLPSG